MHTLHICTHYIHVHITYMYMLHSCTHYIYVHITLWEVQFDDTNKLLAAIYIFVSLEL